MKDQTQNNEFSGITGKISAWMMSGLPRKILERIAFGNPLPLFFKILNLKGDEVVVDSGCGSGFYSLAIGEKLVNGKVISVDISNEMLDKLRRQVDKRRLNNRIEVRKGDCTDIPVVDNFADVGIIVAVWHHLSDTRKANKELFRVIKPSGRIIAIDFKDGGHHNQDIGNDNYKTLGIMEMNAILKDAGFVNIKVEFVGSWVVGYADKP